MTWEHVVDLANVVTAISAVVAIVVAVVLGLKGIRVASTGNDDARQAFLYDQVNHVLESALILTSATSNSAVGATADDHELNAAHEAFVSRIQILVSLELVADSAAAVGKVRQFAAALTRLASAISRLRREGNRVLGETLNDAQCCGHTEELLKDIVTNCVEHEEDRRNIDDTAYAVFQGSPSVAKKLLGNLSRDDWEPTRAESIRLLAPWLQGALGIISVTPTPDGPYLRTTRYDEEYPDRDTVGSWSVEAIDAWLTPRLNFSGPLEEMVQNDPVSYLPVKTSPADLATEWLQELRGAFLHHLAKLIVDLREGSEHSPSRSN